MIYNTYSLLEIQVNRSTTPHLRLNLVIKRKFFQVFSNKTLISFYDLSDLCVSNWSHFLKLWHIFFYQLKPFNCLGKKFFFVYEIT